MRAPQSVRVVWGIYHSQILSTLPDETPGWSVSSPVATGTSASFKTAIPKSYRSIMLRNTKSQNGTCDHLPIALGASSYRCCCCYKPNIYRAAKTPETCSTTWTSLPEGQRMSKNITIQWTFSSTTVGVQSTFQHVHLLFIEIRSFSSLNCEFMFRQSVGVA